MMSTSFFFPGEPASQIEPSKLKIQHIQGLMPDPYFLVLLREAYRRAFPIF